MKEMISVVVPIYNVEKYLAKCIESIIAQTYNNLEIILVDDGSTDNCGKICDDYAKKDQRIKVIHKANGGLSDARNAGIEAAKGYYIGFVDSDDYINVNMYERLSNIIKTDDSKIAVCNFSLVYEEMRKNIFDNNDFSANYLLIDNKDKLLKYSMKNNYDTFTVAWNKLYLRELFNDIRYPKGKIHEDVFTTYKLLYKAQKISYTKDAMYYYLQRETSITKQKFSEKRLHQLDALQEQLEFYQVKKEQEMWDITLFYYKLFLIHMLSEVEKNTKLKKDMMDSYKKFYNEQIKKYLGNSCIQFKKKVGYWLYYKFPKFYLWIYYKKN